MTLKDQDRHRQRNRIWLLGCPFDPITEEQAVTQVIDWCRDNSAPHSLVTVNAAILMMMKKDPELREACIQGDIVGADGVPVVWASRLLGQALPGRVNGTNLMERLLRYGGNIRTFFLGATEEVNSELVRYVRKQYPTIEVVGRRNGYFGTQDHDEVIRQIRESAPELLFVGMPTPFKEVWCHKHRYALGAAAIIGVGGSFDVVAGFTRRAPKWMQEYGLEWLWRLSMEPRRLWKRYLVTNTQFIICLGKELARRRAPRSMRL